MQRAEFWAAIVTASAAVTGIIVTGWQFNTAYALDSKKPFLEEQMKLCQEISTLTATIATVDKNNAEYSNSLKRFWILYYGPMNMVEDNTVEHHLVCFGRNLNLEPRNGCNDASLKMRSISIAKSCRDRLASSWGIEKHTIIGSEQD